MRIRLSRGVSALLCWALLGCAVGGSNPPEDETRGQQKTNPEALVLADFQKRIHEYMKLRNKLEKQAPPLKETADPAKIQASQDGLADRIRGARKGAKHGDIFTPEIQQAFRRLMYPELKGADGVQTKEAMKEDAPKAVPLKVNAKYPEEAPLPTVPPNVLAALPRLPEELEYRFINRDLILRDVHANLIVDYIQNIVR